MHFADVLAIGLVLAGGGAFVLGTHALDRVDDAPALCWLLVGAVALRGGTYLFGPKEKA